MKTTKMQEMTIEEIAKKLSATKSGENYAIYDDAAREEFVVTKEELKKYNEYVQYGENAYSLWAQDVA